MRKLVEVETRAQFDTLNKQDYAKSIVFIKDTKEIWTHGTFYTQRLKEGTIAHTDLTTDWQELLELNLSEAGTYAIQLQYGGVFYSGLFSYSAYTGASNQNYIEEEIPLHASGISTFNGNEKYARIYLKLGLVLKNGTYKEALLIGASKNDGASDIPIKIRQII